MPESLLTIIEHHVSFGAVMLVCGVFLKNHKLFLKAKDRLNDLWWDRCGLRRDRYTPVENGTPAVIPDVPDWAKQNHHGD